MEKEKLFEKTSVPLTIIAEMSYLMEQDVELEELKVMMLSMVHAEDDLKELQKELQAVLEQIVSAGGSKKFVGELTLVQDLSEFYGINDTQTQFDEEITVPEIISKMAKSKPDAIALTYEDEQVTYSTLDKRIGLCFFMNFFNLLL